MSIPSLITALITPFKENRIDEEGLRQGIAFQLEEGVEGLLFLGTTGEGGVLSDLERVQILEIAKQEAKGKAFILTSCGDISTSGAISKAFEATKYGADGLLIITPYYSFPSQEGIYAHFEAVSKKTSLPIILYNHPKRAGVEIKLETMSRLAKLPNIIGVKDASGSISVAADIIESIPGLDYFAGDDALTLPSLSLGAKGTISTLSNLMPKMMKELILTQSHSLFKELYPFMRMTQIETNPVPLKAMMNLAGLPAGHMRLPHVDLSGEKYEKLKRFISEQHKVLEAVYD